MAELRSQVSHCLQHFLVLELVVVAALEVERPAVLLSFGFGCQQLLHGILHAEKLCLKCLLDGSHPVAIASQLALLRFHVRHNLCHHLAGVHLCELWVDLDKDAALPQPTYTLTFVSMLNSTRDFLFCISLISSSRLAISLLPADRLG